LFKISFRNSVFLALVIYGVSTLTETQGADSFHISIKEL